MSVMTGKSHLQSNGSLVGPLSPIQADRNYRIFYFLMCLALFKPFRTAYLSSPDVNLWEEWKNAKHTLDVWPLSKKIRKNLQDYYEVLFTPAYNKQIHEEEWIGKGMPGFAGKCL